MSCGSVAKQSRATKALSRKASASATCGGYGEGGEGGGGWGFQILSRIKQCNLCLKTGTSLQNEWHRGGGRDKSNSWMLPHKKSSPSAMPRTMRTLIRADQVNTRVPTDMAPWCRHDPRLRVLQRRSTDQRSYGGHECLEHLCESTRLMENDLLQAANMIQGQDKREAQMDLQPCTPWLPERQTTRRLAVRSIPTLARAGIAWQQLAALVVPKN